MVSSDCIRFHGDDPSAVLKMLYHVISAEEESLRRAHLLIRIVFVFAPALAVINLACFAANSHTLDLVEGALWTGIWLVQLWSTRRKP